MDDFYAEVYAYVAGIPRGRVVSYGQIAAALGYPRRARMVGRAMSFCPSSLPYHRVVRSDGTLADGGGLENRRSLLLAEDVPFISEYRVDIRACRWDGEAQ